MFCVLGDFAALNSIFDIFAARSSCSVSKHLAIVFDKPRVF